MQPSKNFKCPPLDEVSPILAECDKKIAELTKSDSDLQKRINDITASVRKNNRSPADLEKDARVAALTGDAEAEASSEKSVELALLLQQAADFKSAIEVMRMKRAHERLVASKAICERFASEYTRRVALVCKRVLELRDAVANYEQMVGAFQDADVAWSRLRPMAPAFFGDTRDKHSAPAAFLHEAVRYGFIPATEIPQGYK
jgi:hypothetical protein